MASKVKVNTRQMKRQGYRNRAKIQAKKMAFTHQGVPRKERRKICFQIQKETMATDHAKNVVSRIDPGKTIVEGKQDATNT